MRFHVEQPAFSAPGLRREVGRAVFRSRRHWRLQRVYLAVFRAMLLLCAVLMLLAAIGSFTTEEPAAGAVFLLIAAGEVWLALCWQGLWERLTGRLTLKSLKGPGNTCFYDDHLEDLDDGMSLSWRYDRVGGLYEGELSFYVFLDNRLFLILQKKYFTLGSPDQFRVFMAERCGGPFLPLNGGKRKGENSYG